MNPPSAVTPAYRRLPGRRFSSAASQHSLWLGGDHLLSVNSTGFTEQYRRFYLRDIAAIVVRRTKRWFVWGMILVGTMLFSAWIAAALYFGSGGAEPLGIFFGLFVCLPSAVALVVHLLRGPTCSFRVQTAVQTWEVPAVGRMRAAEKTLALLVPLILASQPAAAAPVPSPVAEPPPTTPAPAEPTA